MERRDQHLRGEAAAARLHCNCCSISQLWRKPSRVVPSKEVSNAVTAHSPQLMAAVLRGERPALPPAGTLPGGPPGSGYVELMHRCWTQQPENRPTFAGVAADLKALIENQALAPAPPPPDAAESASCVVCMEHPPSVGLLHRATSM